MSSYFSKADIAAMERIPRSNLINSITGIKPANLVGSYSPREGTNLAIFSSMVHLGSNPALIGFILRPAAEVCRHTYDNILETGVYTINQVNIHHLEQAHYTSAKFARDESEFNACGFTEDYHAEFKAPFVAESRLKMGMELVESIPIELNETRLIIGEIKHLILDETAIEEGNHLNLETLDAAGISGLNSYYSLKKEAQFKYARTSELPDFK